MWFGGLHGRVVTVRNETGFAGLGVRFVALLVDFLLICAIFFPITRLVKGVWLMAPQDHRWVYGLIITDPLCIIFLAAIFLYFALLEGLAGATLGKRVLGIRVVGPEGRRPGLRRGFLRNLLRLVDGLPALNIVGVILILTSPERARLGDRIADTRVKNK